MPRRWSAVFRKPPSDEADSAPIRGDTPLEAQRSKTMGEVSTFWLTSFICQRTGSISTSRQICCQMSHRHPGSAPFLFSTNRSVDTSPNLQEHKRYLTIQTCRLISRNVHITGLVKEKRFWMDLRCRAVIRAITCKLMANSSRWLGVQMANSILLSLYHKTVIQVTVHATKQGQTIF